MNGLIKTTDQWIFDQLSYLTVRWVKKHKHKKHKYHLFGKLKIYEICLFVFIGAILATLGIYYHSTTNIFLGCFFIFFVGFLEWMDLQVIALKAYKYDDLFDNRKNPVVYNAVKAELEILFEEGASWRQFYVGLNLFVLLLMMFHVLTPFLITFYVFGIYRSYVDFIFDFDEPDERKPAQYEVTEIIKQVWQRLADSVRPAPAPSPV